MYKSIGGKVLSGCSRVCLALFLLTVATHYTQAQIPTAQISGDTNIVVSGEGSGGAGVVMTVRANLDGTLSFDATFQAEGGAGGLSYGRASAKGSFSGSTSTLDPLYFTSTSDWSNSTNIHTGTFNFPNLGISFPYTSAQGGGGPGVIVWEYHGTITPPSFDYSTSSLILTEVRGFVTNLGGGNPAPRASTIMSPLPPPSPYQ